MKEYEVFIEEINPCGGKKNARKEIIEVKTDSPEAYVKENGRFPIVETGTNDAGDVVITTGDGHGIFVKYTFSE